MIQKVVVLNVKKGVEVSRLRAAVKKQRKEEREWLEAMLGALVFVIVVTALIAVLFLT